MTNSRNAILVAGFARNYQDYIDEFKKNLITTDNIDIFGCFWNYVGTRSFEKHKTIKKTTGENLTIINDKKVIKMLDKNQIKDDYGAKRIKIFDLDLITSIINPQAKIIEKSDLVPTGLKFAYHIERFSLIFFMLREVFLLMEDYENKNNIRYSNVARARTDLVRGCYYPKIDWKKDFNSKIYVADHPWSGIGKFAINDHFAIGERDIMEKYFKFYNHLDIAAEKFKTNEFNSTFNSGNKIKTKAWSAEHSLSIYLHSINIGWEKIGKLN